MPICDATYVFPNLPARTSEVATTSKTKLQNYKKMAQKDTEDTEDAAEYAKRHNFCYLKMRDLLSNDDLSNHLTW